MNPGWAWVLAGGVAETVWATTLKLSDGFTDVLYSILTLTFLAISMYFLNRGFRAGLPTGPCYAVWVGIGAVGSVIIGLICFGEVLPLAGWVCMALIIAGVVGLNLAESE
ncbi:DMT family transporter [Candidatus Methanoprimaticola sp. MG2]|uniref:DMT family transporter n=1 Tax=Candidatus Methanoprimaticola sp. MG2 TaxID=3228838 RepID=UPI0039C6130E